MESIKTVLITGSNRGIGYILSQQLSKNSKYSVIMTSRNQILGQQALKTIKEKFHQSQISYHQLDISNSESIEKLIQYLTSKRIFIDILVNNAALGYDQPYQIPSQQLASSYFNCNYYSTVNFTQQILKLLSQDAKIINVSSRTGALENHAQNIQKQLMDHNITKQDIHNHINKYLKGCRQGNLEGYYKSSYATSKTFLNIWGHSILKKQLKFKQSVILMSPGFCLTDMIKNSRQDPRTDAPPPKDPLVGIQTILYIIQSLPYNNQHSGKFYYDKKQWNIHQMK